MPNEVEAIKSRIISYDPKTWWGDDADVRFYLISKIKKISDKKILDLGGGIGIISGELNNNNFRYNLDHSFEDLKKCVTKVNQKINPIAGEMTNIPFKDNSFDCVISSSVLQYAKNQDLQKKNTIIEYDIKKYPTVEKTLSEIYRVLNNHGKLYLVTPNNSYYKSFMLNYDEIKAAFTSHFKNYVLYFFNTFPRLSSKYRKLNLANTVPKLLAKVKDRDEVIQSLIKNDKGVERNSVSFYIEAIKE